MGTLFSSQIPRTIYVCVLTQKVVHIYLRQISEELFWAGNKWKEAKTLYNGFVYVTKATYWYLCCRCYCCESNRDHNGIFVFISSAIGLFCFVNVYFRIVKHARDVLNKHIDYISIIATQKKSKHIPICLLSLKITLFVESIGTRCFYCT